MCRKKIKPIIKIRTKKLDTIDKRIAKSIKKSC